jgi:FMN-dependent NADH-azoreductase
MKTLLEIRSSMFADQGESSRLADNFVAAWREANPDGKVLLRDLAREPIPHLDAATVRAFNTPAEERTPAQKAIVTYSDALIAELKRADVLVLAVPMYNFAVPSTLKAYFDHIARAGETFRYTEKGPVGLVTGKQAYVFAARGGVYAGTPADTQTPFLRTFLGFIGIGDVEFVYGEGLNIGPEVKEKALASAGTRISELVAPLRRAA